MMQVYASLPIMEMITCIYTDESQSDFKNYLVFFLL